jgi:hypothetical protein
LALYINIAILADYYEMEDCISFHMHTWLANLEPRFATVRSSHTVRWIFFAWKDKNWQLFKSVAILLMAKEAGKIDFLDIYFPLGMMT